LRAAFFGRFGSRAVSRALAADLLGTVGRSSVTTTVPSRSRRSTTVSL